ncbi:hypothetical protein HK097_001336 [Rhizophlyctis rosea]|uniref:Uncharacterized protein n=1 Tax=Rhizophlyctis rosea TaxID=64517 RepID=A0AAD5SGX8_9FUNG|nr:hypothetical protein HK097_001336 [Rhizophlyctis rosea]
MGNPYRVGDMALERAAGLGNLRACQKLAPLLSTPAVLGALATAVESNSTDVFTYLAVYTNTPSVQLLMHMRAAVRYSTTIAPVVAPAIVAVVTEDAFEDTDGGVGWSRGISADGGGVATLPSEV